MHKCPNTGVVFSYKKTEDPLFQRFNYVSQANSKEYHKDLNFRNGFVFCYSRADFERLIEFWNRFKWWNYYIIT